MIKNAKFCIIHKCINKYPISTMCRILKCSRSGYYDWVKRLDREDKDDIIAGLIYDWQVKSNYIYGYRRIKNWLFRELKRKINHKTVLRIMTKYGLHSQIRRKKRHSYHHKKAHVANNILSRDFSTDNKNNKWVTDISYIHCNDGVYYLSVIKDLHDGIIIAHKLGRKNDMGLVADTLRLAKKEIANGLILHSDQGTQYTSAAYHNLCIEYNITPSMSRVGTPLDNAPIESFFGTLKCECIYRNKPRDFDHAVQLIDEYVHFYNYIRLQNRTKMTPYEKRCLRIAV